MPERRIFLGGIIAALLCVLVTAIAFQASLGRRAGTAAPLTAAPRQDADAAVSLAPSAADGGDGAAPVTGPVPPGIVAGAAAFKAAAAIAPQNDKELGVWVWTPLTEMDPQKMQQVVNAAAANRFNAIYLTIDDYLDIKAMPEGADKSAKLANYYRAAQNFLALAATKGIQVDAEAGWRDWGQPENRQKAYDILAFVAAYDQTHVPKFRGVQYDIEPYLLSEYENDQEGVLTSYVELMSGLAAWDRLYRLPLTVVVPHFFDAAQDWTPQVTVDGVTAYTYDHLLRILGTLPQGRIIVMAYRNTAAGANGSIALARAEVQGADAGGVKVLVAQETGPVSPAYVTFNGHTRAELAAQIAAIQDAFAADRSFAGISINYLDPFLKLE